MPHSYPPRLSSDMYMDVGGQARPFIDLLPEPEHLTEVVLAGKSLEAGLAVQLAIDLVQGPTELAVQVGMERGVDVAGAGPPHQALERGKEIGSASGRESEGQYR